MSQQRNPVSIVCTETNKLFYYYLFIYQGQWIMKCDVAVPNLAKKLIFIYSPLAGWCYALKETKQDKD